VKGHSLYTAQTHLRHLREVKLGQDLRLTLQVLAEREFGRASCALQILVGRPSNILQACDGEQRQEYLPRPRRG